MFLKHNILANYASLAHVPNPSIPVGGFLERRGGAPALGDSRRARRRRWAALFGARRVPGAVRRVPGRAGRRDADPGAGAGDPHEFRDAAYAVGEAVCRGNDAGAVFQ